VRVLFIFRRVEIGNGNNATSSKIFTATSRSRQFYMAELYIPTIRYDQYTDRKGNFIKMSIWRYDQYSDRNGRF
jgi:hypothetical protein